MIQRLILALGQFGADFSSSSMGEKAEFQEVDRAQRRLSPLNPLTLGCVFLAPMAKFKLKTRGIDLRFQAGEVVVDLAAETADLRNGNGSVACHRANS